jgi:hypothetical protein
MAFPLASFVTIPQDFWNVRREIVTFPRLCQRNERVKWTQPQRNLTYEFQNISSR